MPAIINCLRKKNGVFFNSADDAAVAVVEFCSTIDLLSLLCKASEDKHPTVREATMKYMARLLEKQDFGKTAVSLSAEIEGAIKRTILDPAAPVRGESRKVFFAYKDLCPTQASVLASSFDSSVQKRLETRPTVAAPQESIRDRLMKAKLSSRAAGAVAVPLSEECVFVGSPASIRDATPPKSGAVEEEGFVVLSKGQRAERMIAAVISDTGGAPACPHSTPVVDAVKGPQPNDEETRALLSDVAQTLKLDMAPTCPGGTPMHESSQSSSSHLLLKDVSVTLMQLFPDASVPPTPASESGVPTPASPQKHEDHPIHPVDEHTKATRHALPGLNEYCTPQLEHCAPSSAPSSPKKEPVLVRIPSAKETPIGRPQQRAMMMMMMAPPQQDVTPNLSRKEADNKKAKRVPDKSKENKSAAKAAPTKAKSSTTGAQRKSSVKQSEVAAAVSAVAAEQSESCVVDKKEPTPVAKRTRRRVANAP